MTTVEQIREVLAHGPALRLAVLFGSLANGTEHPGSDADIAILPEDGDLPLSAELALAARLALAVGREVDLVRLDHASTFLRWQVARNAILVAGTRRELVRFQAAAASDYAEIGDAMQRSGDTFRRRILRAGS